MLLRVFGVSSWFCHSLHRVFCHPRTWSSLQSASCAFHLLPFCVSREKQGWLLCAGRAGSPAGAGSGGLRWQQGQQQRCVSQAGRQLWHGGLDPLTLQAELPVPSVSSVAWKEENSHDRGLKLAVKQEHPVQQWVLTSCLRGLYLALL